MQLQGLATLPASVQPTSALACPCPMPCPDGAVACRNRYAWLMACCAPIVLSWSGGSNLAGFPLSLADACVDPFPQQVGVAAVAGVLLDHLDNHFAQRDGVSVSHSPADAEAGEPATNFSAKATSSRQACQASFTTAGPATAPARSASARSPDQYSGGASACAITRRNQLRSTSAMWRMRPGRDMAEGGTGRRASWAGSRYPAAELRSAGPTAAPAQVPAPAAPGGAGTPPCGVPAPPAGRQITCCRPRCRAE